MVTQPDPSSPAQHRAMWLDGVFANPIIFDNLIQYLPLSTLFRLVQVSKSFCNLLFHSPKAFRYLDLSRCKGAYIPSLAPIDGGGCSWRAQRMDENLTEDEFYAGPLRGVLSKLRRRQVLHEVHTLVLDGIASVTNDVLYDIITGADFNVRILSIRKCVNVNHARLQQLLRHICRPGRPVNTPRLQGLYLFTDPAADRSTSRTQISSDGITLLDGATLGILPTDKSQYQHSTTDVWYAPTGQVIEQGYSRRSSWEETLQACKGIIAFDAVLCSHMHEAMADCLHEASSDFLEQEKPGILPLATVALGPDGCTGCGSVPVETPIWGQSDPLDFPLLSPPPHSGKIIDAVRPPARQRTNSTKLVNGPVEPQRLIVSCSWCLVNRHCDSCHRWWCASCYNPKKSKKLADLEALSREGLSYLPSRRELSTTGAVRDSVKVFNRLCVENCLVGEMMAGAGSFGMWA